MNTTKIPSTDIMLVACHWVAAATLTLSLLTGLRIAADDPDAVLSRLLASWLPQGRVFRLHVLAGLVLAATSAAYWAYLRQARLLTRLHLPAEKARAALARGGRQAWRARNLRLQQAIYLLVALLGASGLCLYFGVPLPFGLAAAQLDTLHAGLAWALLAAVALHVAAEYQLGAATATERRARPRAGMSWLLKMLRPRLRPSRGTLQANPVAVGAAAAAAVVAGGGLYTLDRTTWDTLVLHRVAADRWPVLDGRGDDPVWRDAPTAEVLTQDGANLPRGESLVEVQGVSDGRRLYLKFRWEDPTRSLLHLPLRKTAEGWRLLHEEYDIEDEDLFYEDKFAVLISTAAQVGGGVTQLGPRPLPGKPGGLSGRGLHYTDDGSIADLWHWKAVRSQPLGFLDDNCFGPPAEPKPEEAAGETRYKGGYQTDPGKAAYKNNFTHEGPGGYRGDVRPARLPADPPALQARLGGGPGVDPHGSHKEPWALTEVESVPYAAERDASIPIGTVIPGAILGEGGFAGDRGDVRATANWEAGRWTLELVRELDTGSRFDVPVRPGEPVYVWVSVFDHTQTRHSRHMRPIRLELLTPDA